MREADFTPTPGRRLSAWISTSSELESAEPGAHGQLDKVELDWDRRTALGFVMAAHGYPAGAAQG